MNDDTHIIDIDHIVLIGRPERALIEAELQRIVAGAGIATIIAAPNAETTLAYEVARSIAQAIQGGETSPHAHSRAHSE
jgi:hypothetical protein